MGDLVCFEGGATPRKLPAGFKTPDHRITAMRKLADLLAKMVRTERTEFPDNITVGTPSKGGSISLYVNTGNLEEATERLENARMLLNATLEAHAHPGTSIKVMLRPNRIKPDIEVIQPKQAANASKGD